MTASHVQAPTQSGRLGSDSALVEALKKVLLVLLRLGLRPFAGGAQQTLEVL